MFFKLMNYRLAELFRLRTWIVLCTLPMLVSVRCIAATYHVSPFGNDNNSGSAGAPYKTIQAAINNAANGDVVVLDDGLYTGGGNWDIDFSGKNITLKSEHGAGATILDCGGTPDKASQNLDTHLGIHLHSGETQATVVGLTIKNSYGSGNAAIVVDGESKLTVVDCVLRDSVYGCTSGQAGRGASSTTLTLRHCKILNNQVNGVQGRWIALSDCIISGNSGSGIYGGRINADHCEITGNIALVGGGIHISDDSTISDCVIDGNKADADGGGIEIDANHNRILHCTITNNVCARNGGGIWALPGYSDITISGCAIIGNTASQTPDSSTDAQGSSGGGFYGSATLANCDVSGNHVSCQANDTFSQIQSGGGVSLVGGRPKIEYCTIERNEATGPHAQAGGLENAGAQSTICNSILWDNYSTTEPEIVATAGVVPPALVSYSDIEGGFSGVGNMKSDPMFMNANGVDDRLQNVSPCIGRAKAIVDIATDIVGDSRRLHSSMGAFENGAAESLTSYFGSRSGFSITLPIIGSVSISSGQRL